MFAVALKFCFLVIICGGAVIAAVSFIIVNHTLAFGVGAFVLLLGFHRVIS